MKMLGSTDIFQYLNSGQKNEYTKRINMIVAGDKNIVDVGKSLDFQLTSIQKNYKLTVISKIREAIVRGQLILYYTKSPMLDLPQCLPFFKFTQNKISKVMVNLTRYINVKVDKDSGDEEYDIDLKQLYSLILPAYYSLTVFNDKTVLNSKTIESSAKLWAEMFNKINIKILGISSSSDKMDTFRYFAMMYHMIYMLETPEKIAESIAVKSLRDGKPSLVVEIESKCEARNINIYQDFATFCGILYNNEFTKIRASGKSIKGSDMDYQFYIKNFIRLYQFSAYLALASYPYFVFTLCAAQNMSHINNVNAFEDIVRGNLAKDLQTIFVELNKF